MGCPPAFIDQRIDIPNTFNGYHFFKDHAVNEWDFRHFLKWKNISKPLTTKELKLLVHEYKDVISTLMKTKTLPDNLHRYLGRLKMQDWAQTSEDLFGTKEQSATTTYLTQIVNTGSFFGVLSGNLHTTSTGGQQQQPSSSRLLDPLGHAASSSSTQSPAEASSLSVPPQEQDHEDEGDSEYIPQLQVGGVSDIEHTPSHADTDTNFRPMTPQSTDQFKQSYGKMVGSMKWKLNSTGRFVEDVLYDYGLKLKKERCIHSFILDTDDGDVRALFDDDEWKEVQSKFSKEDPPLPDNAVKLLHDLNQTDVDAVYDILKDSTRRYEDYNTKSICYAVESILFLLEADPNPLKSKQLEQWYQSNVWTPVMDKLLNDLPGVVCVLGESTSVAREGRKRQEPKQPVTRMVTRSDMIIRKVGTGVVREYGVGVGEDSALYDGSLGRRRMHEAELKLPKTMKDMMTVLCNECDWDTTILRQIEVIGYCHSGTVSEFIVMDNPSGYICRLTRSDHYEVPSDISEFSKLLLLLAISLRLKLRILRSIDAMKKIPLDIY